MIIQKRLDSHATEYYSAIKGNGVPIQTTVWMNLKNIKTRERSQTQKSTYCMILWIGVNYKLALTKSIAND